MRKQLQQNRNRHTLDSCADDEASIENPSFGEWRKNPRAAPYYASSGNSINLTDLIEDKTIDARHVIDTPERTHRKQFFEPSEITGRSTECSNAPPAQKYSNAFETDSAANSPTVEEILAESFSSDVRQMAARLSEIRFRESYGERRTADMSVSSQSSKSDYDWGTGLKLNLNKINEQTKIPEEEAFNSSKIKNAILDKDEKSWAEEYADVPSTELIKEIPKSINEMDNKHSYDTSSMTESPGRNFSIGQFFLNRCDDVRTMIPNKSPKKKYKNAGLLPSPNSSTEFVSKVEEESSNRSSLMSVSKIAQHLENEDSPRSLAIKLLKNLDDKDTEKIAHPQKTLKVQEETPLKIKSPQKQYKILQKPSKQLPGTDKQSTCHIDATNSPLADILYITKPLPLANNTVNNAQILKYEEFIGNPVKAMVNLMPLDRLKTSCTELTPNRQHIVSKTFRKNISYQFTANNTENKENIDTVSSQNTEKTLSDTLSVCDSMLDDQLEEIHIDDEQGVVDNATYTNEKNNIGGVGTTRKRSRQSITPKIEVADCFASTTQHVSQCNDSNVFKTPPRHQQLSPYNMEKVSGLQSKSRLKGMVSEANTLPTQNHLPAEQTKSPSPNKHSPVSSTVSSPRFCSNKSENGHNECSSDNCVSNRPRSRTRSRSVSPTLLGQCNSQCMGSSNDLRSISCKVDIGALKSSHTALCWESTKLRKNSIKNFTIKNIAHRKLVLKMDIIGPGFQISGFEQSCSLTLQAHECRTISVIFCPTMTGPAIGSVRFSVPRDIYEQNSRLVQLFGYGGNTLMQIQDIDRAPVGSPFLTLGDVQDLTQSQSLQRSFTLYNRGPLNGMAVIRVKAATKNGTIIDPSNVFIHPNKCIIGPDSYQAITVTFQPRRSDLKKLLKSQSRSVITVASLELIYGDDPLRQRIARLIGQSKNKNDQYNTLEFLISGFPNEQPVYFGSFEENMSHVTDLCGALKTIELILTLNRLSLNETTDTEPDMMLSGMDETLMFRTLLPATTSNTIKETFSTISNDNIPIGNSQSALTTQSSVHGPIKTNTWSVYPLHLNINPSSESDHTKYIIITSNLSKVQSFELISSFRQVLECRPSSGILKPGDQVQVSLKIRNAYMAPDNICLGVYIENDKIDVMIKIQQNFRRVDKRWD